MKARHLIFVLAIVIACLLLPRHAIQAEEEVAGCFKPVIRSILPRAGTAGDLVTIRGIRFGEPSGEVIFTPEVHQTEIVRWGPSLIRVRVPQSASTGPVFVRARCGSESNKVDFTVNE
jgi:hypothetical protein